MRTQVQRKTMWEKLVLGRLLVTTVAITMLVLAGSARATVIGFETSEGFPLQDTSAIEFTGSAVPTGVVSSWDNTSGNAPWRTATLTLWHPSVPGGLANVQEGAQYAAIGFDAPGAVSGTMDLVNSGSWSLQSFYWAWRDAGSGSTLSGGGASFVAEYFGLNNLSLGTEQFFGGHTPGGTPLWTLATVSLPAAIGVPLSKVTFTGTPDINLVGNNGTFFLDEIMVVEVVVPEPTPVALALGAGLPLLLLWNRKARKAS